MFRSPAHLKLIRSLSCCYCGSHWDVQAAHIRKRTDGGMGMKPSDCYCVPLCERCHIRTQHMKGELTFWGGIDGVYRAIAYALSLVGLSKDEAEMKTREFRKTVIA